MRGYALRPFLALMLLGALSCTDQEAVVIPNLSGTWIVEEERHCGDDSNSTYPVVVTHNGSDLRFYDPALNATVSGTITGDMIHLSGSYFDESVAGTVEIVSAELIVAPSGDVAGGTQTLKFTSAVDPSFSCEGVSNVIATRQQ